MTTFPLPFTGEQIKEKLSQFEVTNEGLKFANGNIEVSGNLIVKGDSLVVGETGLTEDVLKELLTILTNNLEEASF